MSDLPWGTTKKRFNKSNGERFKHWLFPQTTFRFDSEHGVHQLSQLFPPVTHHQCQANKYMLWIWVDVFYFTELFHRYLSQAGRERPTLFSVWLDKHFMKPIFSVCKLPFIRFYQPRPYFALEILLSFQSCFIKGQKFQKILSLHYSRREIPSWQTISHQSLGKSFFFPRSTGNLLSTVPPFPVI